MEYDLMIYCVAPSPAPPLTVDNVYKAVKGVKSLSDLSKWLLGLLHSEFDAIVRQHGSDDLYVKAVVETFLRGESLNYPHPSWRAVIWTLDKMNESHLADKILDYGEPVQGECVWSCTV